MPLQQLMKERGKGGKCAYLLETVPTEKWNLLSLY